MTAYQLLLERVRDDRGFREALAAAGTPAAREEVVRTAGLELPTTDHILEGVSGGDFNWGGNTFDPDHGRDER